MRLPTKNAIGPIDTAPLLQTCRWGTVFAKANPAPTADASRGRRSAESVTWGLWLLPPLACEHTSTEGAYMHTRVSRSSHERTTGCS